LSTGGTQDQGGPNRLLTLVIASIASVVAAVFTSQVWDGGVVGTAAVTPVIVALVKDALSLLTSGRGAPREPAGQERAEPRRRFPVGAIVAAILIGLAAFVIAAVALTVPEVVADTSITGDSGQTTYFGDNEDKPWGKDMSWSDCFDDIKKCIQDIIEANR
jgi:hypothetical protein